VLLLMGVEVRRQPAAGLEPRVHDEVVAVGLEGVAGAMDRIVRLAVHADKVPAAERRELESKEALYLALLDNWLDYARANGHAWVMLCALA
jgi:hypothetical protein